MNSTHFAVVIPALAAVLAVVVAAAWLTRKLGLNRPLPRGAHITMIETIRIDPKRCLHLVQCNGQRLLVATGGGPDTLLGSWPAPAESQV